MTTAHQLESLNMNIIEETAPDVWGAIQDAPSLPFTVVGEEGERLTLSFSGIALTSSYDRGFEVAHQTHRVPEDATVATVFGWGLGDIQRELLKRSELTKLVVVLLNPSVTKIVLEHFDQNDWLTDPRVDLRLGEAYTRVEEPFAVATGSMRLAEESNRSLATSIKERLSTTPVDEPDDLVDTLDLAATCFIVGLDARGSDLLIAFNDALVELLEEGQSEETVKGFMVLVDALLKARLREDFHTVADLLLYEFRPAIA
jgi:hypothetical protein